MTPRGPNDPEGNRKHQKVITFMLAKRQHSLGAPPPWSLKIAALRQKLGYTQAILGEHLHYSAMAVSRWERGSHEPTSACWIQLGNMAGPPDCWFFWQKAGLAVSDVVRHLPRPSDASQPQPILVVAAGVRKKHLKRTDPNLIALPVLALSAPDKTGASGLTLEDAVVVSMLAAPKQWCPNPEHTRCLQVKGASMAPMIRDGDVVAVDTSQTSIVKLKDTIIVVSHTERGLIIATLRRFGTSDVLEPASRDYDSYTLDKNRSWRVLGKVLWWLGKAP